MSKLAIIVGLEDYGSRSNISSVNYAKNDALAFKNVLMTSFKFKDSEIECYINDAATLSTLRNEMAYAIKNFNGDLFVFYYVGHGFYSGKNLLTTYDTSLNFISETSLSLYDDVVSLVNFDNIKRSLFFIDSCAASIDTSLIGRSAISNLSIKEYSKYIKKNYANAIFFSCSPGEKSYSSHQLQHGIWTHFLVKSLSGKDDKAEERDGIITGQSLQDYLNISLADHIKNERSDKIEQTPISKIFSQGSFEVIRFKKEKKGVVSKYITIDFDEYEFSTTSSDYIRNASGFKKGIHKIPTFPAYSFVVRILDSELFDPLEEIKKELVNERKIRLSDIEVGKAGNGAFIKAPLFRYEVAVMLDEEDLSEYHLEHSVQIFPNGKMSDINLLPIPFDTISFVMKLSKMGHDFICYISDIAQDNDLKSKHNSDENSITIYMREMNIKFMPENLSVEIYSDHYTNEELFEKSSITLKEFLSLA